MNEGKMTLLKTRADGVTIRSQTSHGFETFRLVARRRTRQRGLSNHEHVLLFFLSIFPQKKKNCYEFFELVGHQVGYFMSTVFLPNYRHPWRDLVINTCLGVDTWSHIPFFSGVDRCLIHRWSFLMSPMSTPPRRAVIPISHLSAPNNQRLAGTFTPDIIKYDSFSRCFVGPMRRRYEGIDYRCKNGRFSVFASCVTISNHDLLSSSETMVISEIRSWKKHLFEWARCQEAIGGSYFTKKWRSETLQPGLEFDNFKPRLKSSIFKCISLLNGSFFRGWLSGLSERGSQALSNSNNFSSWLADLFFCLHIYILWKSAGYEFHKRGSVQRLKFVWLMKKACCKSDGTDAKEPLRKKSVVS